MESLIGRFAVSAAGHDAETIYLIVGQEDDFLYLCDGKYKPLEKPKRKRRKHVRVLGVSAEEQLVGRLLKKEKIFDHEIKYAIKQYLSN